MYYIKLGMIHNVTSITSNVTTYPTRADAVKALAEIQGRA